MKLYYIANARLPHKKAYAIQIAKMCEGFVETGVDLELIIPAQWGEVADLQEYYKLRAPIHVVILPAFNFYASGKWGFFWSSLSFMVSYSIYLVVERLRGRQGIVYSIDMDTFSFIATLLSGMPCFFETHGGKAMTRINNFFFKRVKGVVVINNIIKEQIKTTLGTLEEKMIVEPNGIDLELFHAAAKDSARKKLLIPSDRKIIMYCGRFYGWKGLEVLADAVKMLPEDVFVYIVGGTKEEFMKVISRDVISEKLVFPGERPYAEVPTWLSAADGLLVLGTKHDSQSYYYTSPMKIFEYMAIERPIVASSTPAIRDILSSSEAVFYEPDNANDLAEKMSFVANNPDATADKVRAAHRRTQGLTWQERARRVAKFIKEKTKVN